MDSIQIRKYIPEDHKDVLRIFSQGIQEHVQNGILVGLKNWKTQIYIVFSFLLGSIWNVGLLVLALVLCIRVGTVFLFYYLYVK